MSRWVWLVTSLACFRNTFLDAETKIATEVSLSPSSYANSTRTNDTLLEIQWRLSLSSQIINGTTSMSDFQLLHHFSKYPPFLRTVEHAHYLCAVAKKHRCACMQMDPNQANVVSFFICFHSNRSGTCKQPNSCAMCHDARQKYALWKSNSIVHESQWKCSCRCAMHFEKSVIRVGSYACAAHCMEEKIGCHDYQPSAPELDCAFLFRHVPIPWFTGIPIAIAGALLGFAYYSRRRLLNLRCHIMRRMNGRQSRTTIALEDGRKNEASSENGTLFSTNICTVTCKETNASSRILLPLEPVVDVLPSSNTMLTQESMASLKL